MGLLGQQGLFLLWWISIVTVLVEPVPEYLYWLFGQVSSPLPLSWHSSVRRKVKRHIQTVLVLRLASGHCQHTCRHTGNTANTINYKVYNIILFYTKRLWSMKSSWCMSNVFLTVNKCVSGNGNQCVPKCVKEDKRHPVKHQPPNPCWGPSSPSS